MKTRDLIRKLQELDPSGEMNVYTLVAGTAEEPTPMIIYVDQKVEPQEVRMSRTSVATLEAILV
mgnify:CR=1 FL=1